MITPKRRWYDTESTAAEIFDKIHNLDNDTKTVLSENLTEIIQQIKNLHREEVDPDLSIGLERVIGLYHQFQNKRRWYDQNEDETAYAIKTLFTLPEQDFYNIIEGLSVSLK
ncbi:hypothetical protein IJ818_03550 [bacterium]|nr:hypothetical protein [bacterium]